MITQNVMKKFEEYCSKNGINGKEKAIILPSKIPARKNISMR